MSFSFNNLNIDHINKLSKSKLILFIKIIIILININICFIILTFINNLSINQSNYNIKDLFELYKLDKLNIYISQINYNFSFKFNITKLIYNIIFYDDKHNIIIPSYLSFIYNLHVFCYSNEVNNNISIIYIPYIYENKYFSCIEYINNNEILKFGILIYNTNKFVEFVKLNLFTNNLINYNNFLLIKDEEFEPLIQIKKFYYINKMIKEKSTNTNINYNNSYTCQLKKLYFSLPNFNIKSYLSDIEEKWYFKNIYNNYFCFCKYSYNSKCLYKNMNQKYKYYLYLYFIDNNRYLYNKTDYLFADFSSENTSPGEAFLIFQEMIKMNLNVYYLTKREDIYSQYKIFNNNNMSYIPIIFDSHFINGDFLEKYFDIFLKLKVVVSGAKIYSFNNLFYNIEYITYICLTHGISYLKDFLYNDYYSTKIYNKIVLPPSTLIINNAKSYGWKDDDIIKIGLPRWDIFDSYEKNLSLQTGTNKNQSIFMMFTWRDLKNNQNISKYYFKNILYLIKNERLNFVLKENNITLYYSLHHMIDNYKYLFNNNKYIKYINQEQIIECLTKSNLIITDFSSIIFDIMIRNKPYIIFIPDSEDPNIDNIYIEDYTNIIKKLKNETICLKNIFFNLENTITKIIFYIDNNFILEPSLQLLYKKFNLKGGNNINNFITYLKNIN